MNLYSIPSLIGLITIVFLAIFVIKNKKTLANILFIRGCISSFVWLIAYFIAYQQQDQNSAILWFRIGYTAVIFIPVMLYQFVFAFLDKKIKSIYIILTYSFACIFIIFLWTTNYFINGLYKYYWGFYPKASLLHPFFICFFSILSCAGLINLYYLGYKNKNISPLESYRRKYLFISLIIGAFGGIDFVPNYGIQLYPIGCIFIVGWIGIIVYAIAKYRLMDIRIAITRTSIFIAIYTIILGLPFAVAGIFKDFLIGSFGQNWWMVPLVLMALLATVGPFIYIYVERKAEDRLLAEQRRYQNTLKQASAGMTRIRNLRKLLNVITHIVTKTVRISYAAIYLHNQETDEYVLAVSRDKGRMSIPKLTSDNPLIKWVMLKKEPLIYEEVKRQMQDSGDQAYMQVEENMRILTASVIIPSFLEDKFMGFIVLGDKLSGQIYTPDDLSVFQVLASQAALAIENAQFYEEAKEMQVQIAQAEKMATIGTMADGLSHQINNRFHVLSLIAGDTIDTIKLTDTTNCTSEVREMINQVNHALTRIQANVTQGGEVVKGMLKYSRKGEEGLEAIDLNILLDNTIEMVQFKVKVSEIDIIRNFDHGTPKMKGNMVQLEEAFFNFIDNAYDAIVERRTTLKEEGYRGRVIVSAKPKDDKLEIIVEDNGMGIKDDNTKKVFTPFFTTKISARKGTGLGLYVINKIITDTHQGKIHFESKHGVGTRFILELPIAAVPK